MILLHVAPIRWGRLAGPAVSVPSLIRAQNALADVQAALVNSLVPRESASDRGFPVFGYQDLGAAPDKLGLPVPLDPPDLVVFHSTYVPRHARLARKLDALAIPYVLCPRGGMTRVAQRHKRWKKLAGNWLFFQRMVAGARAVHCLTAGEAQEVRRWGRPVFVVGNGVEIPPDGARRPGPAVRRLTFIGRLMVRYKGLDLLLDACQLARPRLADHGARVAIHGPDFAGGRRWLQRSIHQLDLGDVVSLEGPLDQPSKRRALAQTDVFLCVSRSEGHPMAVLEALAHGVPCLLTPGTNMAGEVTRAGAGWQVAPTPEGVARGLNDLLELDQAALEAASSRARQLAVQNYRWGHIARESVAAYRKFAA